MLIYLFKSEDENSLFLSPNNGQNIDSQNILSQKQKEAHLSALFF